MAAVKDFSVEEKLIGVLSLQKIDSKIDEIKILKGELPMEVKDLEDEIEGLRTRLVNLDQDMARIQEHIDQRNSNKKDSLALVKKYEKQQESVKNNREFEALNKEIENADLEAQLADKNIRDAEIQRQERLNLKVRTEEKIANIEETLTIKRKELDKIIADTEKEEKALAKLSDAAKERVDPRLLGAYERIRSSYRNGLAVVPIMRDSCGGCFNVIPPQRQSEIRQHKKVIVCEHCGRIVVDSELQEKLPA